MCIYGVIFLSVKNIRNILIIIHALVFRGRAIVSLYSRISLSTGFIRHAPPINLHIILLLHNCATRRLIALHYTPRARVKNRRAFIFSQDFSVFTLFQDGVVRRRIRFPAKTFKRTCRAT